MVLLKIKDCLNDTDDSQDSTANCNGVFWDKSDIVILSDSQVGSANLTADPPTIAFDPNSAAQVDYDQLTDVTMTKKNYVVVRVTNVSDPAAMEMDRQADLDFSSIFATIVPSGTLSGLSYPGSWRSPQATPIGDYISLAAAANVNGYNRTWHTDAIDNLGANQNYKESYFVFAIDNDQLTAMVGWSTATSHPCLLAEVYNPADIVPASSTPPNIVTRFRTLAQRNLTIINLPTSPGAGTGTGGGGTGGGGTGGGGTGGHDGDREGLWSDPFNASFFSKGSPFAELPFVVDSVPKSRFAFFAGAPNDHAKDFVLSINHDAPKNSFAAVVGLDDGGKYFPHLPGYRHPAGFFAWLEVLIQKLVILLFGIKVKKFALKESIDGLAINEIKDGIGFAIGSKRYVLLTSGKSELHLSKKPGSYCPLTIYSGFAFGIKSTASVRMNIVHQDPKRSVIGGLSAIFKMKN